MDHHPSHHLWLLGASSGIGAALALELARAGHRVVVSARRAEALQEVVKQSASPDRLQIWPCDVLQPGAVAAACAGIEQQHGPLDAVLYNVGDYAPMPAERFDAALCARLMAVNFQGAAELLEAVLPRFRARGRGLIAVNASVAGWRGLPLSGGYGASKAALINLMESLQPECRASGIALKVINHGFVATRLTALNHFPMPALQTPEQAARHIARGLFRPGFELSFPARFTLPLKLLRCLPYGLYFRLVASITGTKPEPNRDSSAGDGPHG